MKKLTTLFVAAVLAVSTLCFGACGVKPSGGDIRPEDVVVNLDRNMKATLEVMVPSGNVNEVTMINALIDNDIKGVVGGGITFKDLFPNVEVNVNYVSLTNYASALQQQQLSGNMADVIWSNSPDFYDLVESETFVNLSPFIQANGMHETCNAYVDEEGNPCKFDYEQDFHTNFFDMSTLNNKCYVIPRSADTVVTFLNTEILKAAGVDLNPETTVVKNGWTWDDMLSVCAKVRTYLDSDPETRDDVVLEANLTSWLSVLYPMLLSNGAEVIDKNGNVKLDSAATYQCLEMVAELVEKRYIADSGVAANGTFDNGHRAMIFSSASVSLYAEKMALKNKVDLVSFPLIQNNNTPKIGAGVAGYSISSLCKQKDLAWAFITFMLSKAGQQKMALNGLNLASIRKDLADPEVANWGKEYKDLNVSAYLYGPEYQQATDFFPNTRISAKAGIQNALIALFAGASNSKKSNDMESLLKKAIDSINEAIIDY